jgi:hypothetical protein
MNYLLVAVRAITLHQPWAWAVACGLKLVENRSWLPPAVVRPPFPLVIHAGRHFDSNAAAWLRDNRLPDDPEQPARGDLVYGAVTAVCRVARVATHVDHVTDYFGRGTDQGRFFFGPFGWLLADLHELPEPIPCRGFQRVWRLPPMEQRHAEVLDKLIAGDIDEAAL